MNGWHSWRKIPSPEGMWHKIVHKKTYAATISIQFDPLSPPPPYFAHFFGTIKIGLMPAIPDRKQADGY
jgi:hypothetical protein